MMGLLEPQKTPQEAAIIDFQGTATHAYRTLRSAWERLQQLVWHSPYGLTPQAMFDLLGHDGAAAVQLSTTLMALINAQASSIGDAAVVSQRPTNVTETVNQDGTVTLVES
jgi:hypothetical protein